MLLSNPELELGLCRLLADPERQTQGLELIASLQGPDAADDVLTWLTPEGDVTPPRGSVGTWYTALTIRVLRNNATRYTALPGGVAMFSSATQRRTWFVAWCLDQIRTAGEARPARRQQIGQTTRKAILVEEKALYKRMKRRYGTITALRESPNDAAAPHLQAYRYLQGFRYALHCNRRGYKLAVASVTGEGTEDAFYRDDLEARILAIRALRDPDFDLLPAPQVVLPTRQTSLFSEAS